MTDLPGGPLASADRHPDLDTLADLDAGVLDDLSVRQHVAGCQRCQAVITEFGQVRTRLSALPEPAMPPAVEQRLFAALAAERSAWAAASHPAPPDAAVVSLAQARERRRRRNALLGLVAAGVVVLAGVGVTAGVIATKNPDRQTSAEAPISVGGGAGAANDNAGLPSFSRDTIAQAPAVADILNGGRPPVVTAPQGGPMEALTKRKSCEAGITRTVEGVSGASLTMQHVLFEGKPAYVFVFSAVGSRRIVVVGENCSQADPQLLFDRPVG